MYYRCVYWRHLVYYVHVINLCIKCIYNFILDLYDISWITFISHIKWCTQTLIVPLILYMYSNINLAGIAIYHLSAVFCVGKFWRKWHLEGVLNFHRVLFSLFQGLSMKMYRRVYFFAVSIFGYFREVTNSAKINTHEKFSIYGPLAKCNWLSFDWLCIFILSIRFWLTLHLLQNGDICLCKLHWF